MKLDIVIVHVPRYVRGHEIDFVPPLTGIHLAAITPERYEVRLVHQQVDGVNLETDADLVARSIREWSRRTGSWTGAGRSTTATTSPFAPRR